jgi:hypothetical protein
MSKIKIDNLEIPGLFREISGRAVSIKNSMASKEMIAKSNFIKEMIPTEITIKIKTEKDFQTRQILATLHQTIQATILVAIIEVPLVTLGLFIQTTD